MNPSTEIKIIELKQKLIVCKTKILYNKINLQKTRGKIQIEKEDGKEMTRKTIEYVICCWMKKYNFPKELIDIMLLFYYINPLTEIKQLCQQK